MHYVARYEQRHPKIKDSGEAELINSFQPNKCPFCETTDFIKIGFDANGIRRYKCKCGKTFKPTTGTIFDSRRIPMTLGITVMRCLHQNIGWKSCF